MTATHLRSPEHRLLQGISLVEVSITLASGEREIRRFRSLSDLDAFLRLIRMTDAGGI